MLKPKEDNKLEVMKIRAPILNSVIYWVWDLDIFPKTYSRSHFFIYKTGLKINHNRDLWLLTQIICIKSIKVYISITISEIIINQKLTWVNYHAFIPGQNI